MNFTIKLLICITLITSISWAELEGQLSTVGDLRKTADGYLSQIGLRYVPSWSLTVPWPTALFDIEISFNINGIYKRPHGGGETTDFDTDAYRFWIRRSTNKLELRMGLQKITFGPAKLIRPLMWFDKLDPRDPLQLTEGVWGLRIRRDFANNANIWLWGLLWNNEPMGWDFIPTKKNNIEIGGRYQLPVWKGEIGFSTHNRIISRNDVPTTIEINTMAKAAPEVRAAVDGFFDLGVGLWFESSVVHVDYGADFPNWQTFLTIGSDYTFGIGNGLTVTAEHFIYNQDDKPLITEPATRLTGLMAMYPVSIFDQLSGILYYNWDTELTYFFISWQRTYDDWTINLNTFFSSNSDESFSFGQSITDFSSRGIQLMLIFNH
ncbi:MAG: hypothetical protein V3R52_03095 [Candidatus Neomarinimicrobiota bacterium]